MNLIGIGAGLGGLLKGYEQAGSYLQQQQMNALRMQQAQQAMQQEQQLNQLLDAPGMFSQLSQGGGQMPAIGTGMAGGGVDMSQLPNTSMMGPQAATPMPGQPSVSSQPAMAPTPTAPAPTRYADPLDPSQTPAPQPTQPRQAAGGAPDTMVPSSSTLDLIERDESGGRNIMQTAYSGEGINPSTGTHTAPSTAQGYYQITNSTWREAAPQAGVDVSQYPTAMSAPKEVQRQVAAHLLKTQGTAPWAPYNAKLRADLGQGGGEDTLAASAPPQVQRQAQAVAQNSLWNIPPAMYGRMQLQTAAQMIEKAAPNAPGHVKFMALEKLQKILAPDAKVEMQMLLLNQREAFQQELLNQRLLFQQQSKPEPTGTVYVDPKTGTPYSVRGSTATPITTPGGEPLSGGIQKPGAAGIGKPLSEEATTRIAQEYLAGNKQVLAGLGYGNAGAMNRAAVQEKISQIAKEQGMSGGDISAMQAALTADMAGARAAGIRSANLDVALQEAEQFLPIARDISRKIDRTEYPDLNRVILAGEARTGGEDIIRFTIANRAVAALYSQVLRRGGVPSDQSDREANALLQTAFSKGQYAAAVDQIETEAKAAEKAPSLAIDNIRARIAARAGGGAATPPAKAPTAAPAAEGVPVPPDHAQDPDGTQYKGSDGRTYVKKGDQMVPQ